MVKAKATRRNPYRTRGTRRRALRATSGKTKLNFRFTTTAKAGVAITRPSGETVKKGWLHVSINAESVMVYIAFDKGRTYWIRRKVGPSANIHVKKRGDNVLMFNGYKVEFRRAADCSRIIETLADKGWSRMIVA